MSKVTKTQSPVTVASLLAQMAEMQAQLVALSAPKVPAKTVKAVPVVPASKGVKAVKRVVKTVNVPPVAAKSVPTGSDDVRNVTEGTRIRLYPKDFNKAGVCVINGVKANVQADGKGRFTVKSFGGEIGDTVELTRARQGVYEMVVIPAKAAKKQSPREAVAPVPAKAPKVVPAVPVKTVKKVVRKKGLTKSAASVKESPKRANATVKAASKVLNFAERMKIAKAAKAAKAEAFAAVEVQRGARRVNAPQAVPVVPETADKRGQSKEFAAVLKQFKAMVAVNRANGHDRLEKVPNCPYLKTDGRRYLKGGKGGQISEFNKAATKAGFYGMDGLSEAGQLLLK